MNILKIAAVSALFASNLISIPAMADNHSNSQTAVEAAIEAYWAARNAQTLQQSPKWKAGLAHWLPTPMVVSISH
jgi:hypothetical protein